MRRSQDRLQLSINACLTFTQIRFITQKFQPSTKQFHSPYPSYHIIATGFFLNFVEKRLRSARGTAKIIDRWGICLENDGYFLAISVI